MLACLGAVLTSNNLIYKSRFQVFVNVWVDKDGLWCLIIIVWMRWCYILNDKSTERNYWKYR